MKLAILLYGTEAERPLLNPIMEKLQKQLNQINKDDVEVVFFADKGESSVEEKKNWLLEQTTSKHYVFINSTTDIPDNFLLLRYNAIKYGKTPEEQLELQIYHK